MSEGADECSIQPREAVTGDMEPEDGQQMARHEDLGVLVNRVDLMDADRFEFRVTPFRVTPSVLDG